MQAPKRFYLLDFARGLAPLSIGAWQFFVLRFSRLYPLHFATLIFVATLQLGSLSLDGYSIVYPCNDVYHFVLNLFFASVWGFEQCASFNAPVWSVSVEVVQTMPTKDKRRQLRTAGSENRGALRKIR